MNYLHSIGGYLVAEVGFEPHDLRVITSCPSPSCVVLCVNHRFTSKLALWATPLDKIAVQAILPSLTQRAPLVGLITRRKKKSTSIEVLCLVAEVGFEPHDLRVMSPTSYQAALLRDMDWCRRTGSNRHGDHSPRDFKSRVSANSTTPAYRAGASRFTCLAIIAQNRVIVKPLF